MRGIAFAFLSITAVGVGYALFAQHQGSPVAIPKQAISITLAFPSMDSFFLTRQMERLATEMSPLTKEPVSPSIDSIAETTSPESISAIPDQVDLLVGSVEELPRLEAPMNPDEEHLHRMASEFAYVEFKGVIGGRPIASFCTDPRSGTCEIAAEGDTFRELQVTRVTPDSVILSYRSASPLEKPLVALEIEEKPMAEMTEEEIALRKRRFDELYGNRFQQASLEYRKKNGGQVFDPPTAEEQRQAAEVYQETYGAFFRALQEGKGEGDNRDYPTGAPTLEESVADYFETYWPEQVEWDVTDENKSEGE